MRLYGRACCEHRCPPSRKTGHAAWKRMVCRCHHPPRRPETCPTCPQTAVCHGADCGLGGWAARCGGSGGAVWWVSTIAGGRAARPAVPESARAHSGGAPAAGFMHAIRRHRPASRAGAAVSRTWLPAGRAVNCAQTGRAEVKNGVRLASSLCAHLRLNSRGDQCTHLAARRRGFALSVPRRPPPPRRTCIPVRRQEPRVTRFGVDLACRRRSFFWTRQCLHNACARAQLPLQV